MNQHTPGPWTVKGVHVGPSKHFRAYSIEPNICEMNSSLAPDDVSANARLIAMAPQLLAALKEAAHALEPLVQTSEYQSYGYAYDIIVNAIAHAEGGTKP